MSELTARLGLPLVAASQAQKHVPVNEAMTRLDGLVQLSVLGRTLAEPPEAPANGDRYVVAAGGTGAWAGHDDHIASYDDGWIFLAPREGWLAWDVEAQELLVFADGSWAPLAGGSGALQNIPLFGVGTQADFANPFAAKLNTALWTALGSAEGGTGDLRYAMNKEAGANVLSLLLQSGYGGRAEIGLIGDDDLSVKVSADGALWREAIRIDRATGRASFPSGGAREQLASARTYYVRTDGSDSNDGLADSSGGAFLTIQKAIDVVTGLDLGIYDVIIQLGDGTYTVGGSFTGPWAGSGTVTIRGNQSDEDAVIISSGGHCFLNDGMLPAILHIEDMKLTSSAASCITNNGLGEITFSNIVFGSAHHRHLNVNGSGAAIRAVGDYSIEGGAQVHAYAATGGIATINTRTVTFLASAAFSQRFASASQGGGVVANGMTFALDAFSVIGARYNVSMNGWVETAGGGATYFPGNADGAAATGGQYN